MPLISITDPDDVRLAPYVSIREKDLTHGHGARFIVEGKVTLEALIRRSRFEVESLFLAESRLEPVRDILEDVSDRIPIYVVEQSLMDQVAGFPVHRGVLACGIKGEPLCVRSLLETANTVLVLVGLSNHDNVGACFRNATAFGTDCILLDSQSCDPLYRKSIRVSSGTALTLPFVHGGTGDEILMALSGEGFDVWCLTPRADAVTIDAIQPPDRLALILGAEGPGLSDQLMARGRPVRVPMVAGFDSINVATAGAIALNQIFSSKR
ncbi:MAG: RNA methyltransferase [Pseudomonadota bacterium]